MPAGISSADEILLRSFGDYLKVEKGLSPLSLIINRAVCPVVHLTQKTAGCRHLIVAPSLRAGDVTIDCSISSIIH